MQLCKWMMRRIVQSINTVCSVYFTVIVRVLRATCQSVQLVKFAVQFFEITRAQFAYFWPKIAPNPSPDPDPNPNLTLILAKLHSTFYKLRRLTDCGQRVCLT